MTSRRIYAAGRPTDGWERGERLLSLADVREGDVLIMVCHQFKAENLVAWANWMHTEEPFNLQPPGDGFYWQYVTPDLEPAGGAVRCENGRIIGYAVWHWEFESGRTNFYRARRARAEVSDARQAQLFGGG